MQPVKITISGDYIDCQIYRGILYLWTLDGSILVYKWNELVESFVDDPANMIAMSYFFLESNYIYDYHLNKLFKDLNFRELLKEKFSVIDGAYSLSEEQASRFLIKEQDTPDRVIPVDTEIYNNTLYYINEAGLHSATVNRPSKSNNPVSSRPRKLWDCRLLSIKANKYPQIALSAGEEGLYELNNVEEISFDSLRRADSLTPIYKISGRHSSFANYSYLSIYNTSLIDSSYLAVFKWNLHDDNFSSKRRAKRRFDGTIPEEELFGQRVNDQYLSWGVQDKIYRATDFGFEIVKFDNGTANNGPFWRQLDSVHLKPWKGRVIGGGAAYFGTIIECENALVIMLSNGEILTITGPITRWRVYPRSNNYENQLHVILDDRIEIYSFNHDYFVNQEHKDFGIEYTPEAHSKKRW
ncbi:hypothetical protein SAMN05428949_1983 [Chitinophaga sp. YR627]|uniref:hypothetical protein n=1 Tax=Chitinophaga sp. YR627 TaxID=1881041 RepID=UPI0008ED607F|nr:hypothetical protein [Chitinophaga sp. YR627]SFN21916.1 hypothetical protein SAMN05428949_1983 [Chitinophaga sp. YR627]